MTVSVQRFVAAAVLLVALAGLGACALYRNDKCYVPDEQYRIARDLYLQTGSLDLVKQKLNEYQWRRCRVNECLYRLTKEFQVLPGQPRFEQPTTTTQAVLAP